MHIKNDTTNTFKNCFIAEYKEEYYEKTYVFAVPDKIKDIISYIFKARNPTVLIKLHHMTHKKLNFN